MFIPFGSRILPSSWAPSISRFSVAYPRGVIFFTPFYVSFSPGTFLLSFSVLLFSLCLFHSESSSTILLANSHKLAISWRVFNLCAFQISMYDRPSRENYEESHRVAVNITSDVPWASQFILSSYSWSLSFILVVLVTGSLVSLYIARSVCS